MEPKESLQDKDEQKVLKPKESFESDETDFFSPDPPESTVTVNQYVENEEEEKVPDPQHSLESDEPQFFSPDPWESTVTVNQYVDNEEEQNVPDPRESFESDETQFSSPLPRRPTMNLNEYVHNAEEGNVPEPKQCFESDDTQFFSPASANSEHRLIGGDSPPIVTDAEAQRDPSGESELRLSSFSDMHPELRYFQPPSNYSGPPIDPNEIPDPSAVFDLPPIHSDELVMEDTGSVHITRSNTFELDSASKSNAIKLRDTLLTIKGVIRQKTQHLQATKLDLPDNSTNNGDESSEHSLTSSIASSLHTALAVLVDKSNTSSDNADHSASLDTKDRSKSVLQSLFEKGIDAIEHKIEQKLSRRSSMSSIRHNANQDGTRSLRTESMDERTSLVSKIGNVISRTVTETRISIDNCARRKFGTEDRQSSSSHRVTLFGTEIYKRQDAVVTVENFNLDALDDNQVDYLLKHRWMVWDNGLAHALLDLSSSTCWFVIMALSQFIAIYISDLTHSTKQVGSSDEVFDGIEMTIVVFLTLNIIGECLVHRHYPLSFYFFLETLGTLSLLWDISFIYSEKKRYQTSDFFNGRVGRTFLSLRVLAMMRLSRIEEFITITRTVRLARIVQVLRETLEKFGLTEDVIGKFRSTREMIGNLEKKVYDSPVGAWLQQKSSFQKMETEYLSNCNSINVSERVSHLSQLSDLVVRGAHDEEDDLEHEKYNQYLDVVGEDGKPSDSSGVTHFEHDTAKEVQERTHTLLRYILIGLIFSLCMLPISSGVSGEKYRNAKTIRDVLMDTSWQNVSGSSCPDHYDLVVQSFLDSEQKDQHIIYLEIRGKVYRDERQKYSYLRESEKFVETHIYEKIDKDMREDHAKSFEEFSIIIDISAFIWFEHRMNLAFITGVVIVFALIIFAIIKALDRMILNPLQELVEYLEKQIHKFEHDHPFLYQAITSGLTAGLMDPVWDAALNRKTEEKGKVRRLSVAMDRKLSGALGMDDPNISASRMMKTGAKEVIKDIVKRKSVDVGRAMNSAAKNEAKLQVTRQLQRIGQQYSNDDIVQHMFSMFGRRRSGERTSVQSHQR